METYKGSCHCGSIAFEIKVGVIDVCECNCSICRKKGIIHQLVDDSDFNLLEGKENLSLYKFGANVASHWFCRTCGIQTFGKTRRYPDIYTVNVRCLDEFEAIMGSQDGPIPVFNGQQHPSDQVN